MLEGFLLVLITGFCWIGIGIVVSKCSARGLNFNIVQGVNFSGAVLICAMVLAGTGAWSAPSEIFGWRFLVSMLAGFTNFYTFVLASKAMKLGPNGLVWGIMQSGMIGSFLMGVIFFGEKPSLLRLVGLALILSGVMVMGLAKDGKFSGKGKSWVLYSFGAFLLVMATHCCNAMPSFFPVAAKISSFTRALGLFSGGLLGFSITTLPGMIRNRNFGSKREWFSGWIFMALNISASALFFYRGLDRLAQFGCGGLGYPIAIGICVAGFSLYSLLILKEKFSRLILSGLAAVCLGIVIIAIR